MAATENSVRNTLLDLLALTIPQQFVRLTGLASVAVICEELGLPAPTILGGNIVVGDMQAARFLLSAHLDEASFNVASVIGNRVTLAPCHRFPEASGEFSVTLLGLRAGQVRVYPATAAEVRDGAVVCFAEDVLLGDRAVYFGPSAVSGDLLSSRAIDDRAGAAIGLHSLKQLLAEKIPAALVLSDGEQSLPDGYFSRNFPHVLKHLDARCTIVFIDGIFGEAPAESDPLARSALLVPHTGDGRGYTVPPLLFSVLRDKIVPAAVSTGIRASTCSRYHSRGDDWGMITNPTSGQEHAAFFVSFYGWGPTPALRHVNLQSLDNCRAMVPLACKMLFETD